MSDCAWARRLVLVLFLVLVLVVVLVLVIIVVFLVLVVPAIILYFFWNHIRVSQYRCNVDMDSTRQYAYVCVHALLAQA